MAIAMGESLLTAAPVVRKKPDDQLLKKTLHQTKTGNKAKLLLSQELSNLANLKRLRRSFEDGSIELEVQSCNSNDVRDLRPIVAWQREISAMLWPLFSVILTFIPNWPKLLDKEDTTLREHEKLAVNEQMARQRC
ncbi:MAG: hypothetical protein AB8B79_20150 [Granulosicoccus sp.]